MNTSVDLSMWPPALAFSLCVVVIICGALPDVLTVLRDLRTNRPNSTVSTLS